MNIKYYGHSCFTVTSDGYTVAVDPYGYGSVPGLPALRIDANKLLCTHEHGDHNNRAAVRLIRAGRSPFVYGTVKSWHDDASGTKRGKNSVFILEAEGLRVVHFGDIGCMPDENGLEAIGKPDAVMIPVGGYYTIDAHTAAELAARVQARVVIPMHYRTAHTGFGVLSTVEPFLKLMNDRPCYEYGNELELDENTEKQVALLGI